MNLRKNLANKLTMTRFMISFLFIALMVFDNMTCRILALIVFIGAGITDWFDGKIARMNNEESDYGKVVDPLADKVITVTAYVFFVKQKELFDIPAWIVSLIIIREFTISGLRTLGVMYKTDVKTSKLGKWKTLSQFTAIITILIIDIINLYYINNRPELLLKINVSVPVVLMTIVFVTTWISGLDYIIKNKKLVYDNAFK